MHGRPTSLLKVALPTGPNVISGGVQGLEGVITLKRDVETAGNMVRPRHVFNLPRLVKAWEEYT